MGDYLSTSTEILEHPLLFFVGFIATALVLILLPTYLIKGKKAIRTFSYAPYPGSLIESKVWYGTKAHQVVNYEPGVLSLTKNSIVIRDERGKMIKEFSLQKTEISVHPTTGLQSGLAIKSGDSELYVAFYTANLVAGSVVAPLTYLKWQKLLRPNPGFKGSYFNPGFDIVLGVLSILLFVLFIGFLIYRFA